MLYIINMDELGPAEVQLSTSLFQAKISILLYRLGECPVNLVLKYNINTKINKHA